MSLFELRGCVLHSGSWSNWMIDCNSLTDDDLECLAYLGRALVGPFGEVMGIPNGGLRFAKAMEKYATFGPRLIVDDVYTTGDSINTWYGDGVKFLVIFARRQPPPWIKFIWQIGTEVT